MPCLWPLIRNEKTHPTTTTNRGDIADTQNSFGRPCLTTCSVKTRKMRKQTPRTYIRVHLVRVVEDVAEDGDDVGLGGEVRHAEEALELLQHDYDRRAAHEPGDRRPRHEIHQDPQPEEPERRLQDAGEEGRREDELRVQPLVVGRPHLAADDGRHQQRRRRHRPHPEVPRAPHHRVHQRRHEARI
ncbi:Os01g0593900 [Oryza sativa Japonica Group]|uniref:Os01g0593900 protein n=1 Tax=Oryza sativa subsp. japonica TaxID=39947 RepID=A0A0P0V4R3_ORYSJ|nr:hypothetical protein EE612_003838 [Oryza sativa]BAS72968.1 Os01g0593900 [Oryza sativa Japonica Group]